MTHLHFLAQSDVTVIFSPLYPDIKRCLTDSRNWIQDINGSAYISDQNRFSEELNPIPEIIQV